MSAAYLKIVNNKYSGLYIGIGVILLWCLSLFYNLSITIDWANPMTYLMVLVQMHLFTGLFITAHDAMHGTVVAGDRKVNLWIGRISTSLFLFNNFDKMLPKHHEHHRFAGTEHDPDFHNGNENFLFWLFDFIKEYISWKQILLAAITHNILVRLVGVPEINMVMYWIVPSILSLLQLFVFGTYLPHRGEHQHNNPHHARSQGKNHLWAFISCYFFGYHYEHHDKPRTPWWRLWEEK
ncbi:MAG: fatty acid desaturase [Bacteroidota bacterium]